MDFAHQSFPNVTRRFIHPIASFPLPNQDTGSVHSSQGDGMSDTRVFRVFPFLVFCADFYSFCFCFSFID